MFNESTEELLKEVKFFDIELHNVFVRSSSKIRYVKKEAIKREHDIQTLQQLLVEMRCPAISVQIDNLKALTFKDGEIFLSAMIKSGDIYLFSDEKMVNCECFLRFLETKYLVMLFEKAIDILGQ